jgi:hypothetical protein
MAIVSLDSPSCDVPCFILHSVVYRDVNRQAKELYRLKYVGTLKSGLAYLSRYNSGWFAIGALASPLLASPCLPCHSPLLPELPPNATAPPPWKMPAPPPSPHSFLVAVGFFGSCPSYFPSFSLATHTRAPNTTTAPFLHSGAPLFAVGCRRPPPIAHYDPLESFPIAPSSSPAHPCPRTLIEYPHLRAPLRRRFGPPWGPHLRSSLPFPRPPEGAP